jgi:hypothetical protein
VTATVAPAIVAVAVRGADVPFAAIASVTCPLPLPDAGETVTKPAEADAVHEFGEQPDGDGLTVTLSLSPPNAALMAVGVTVNVHGGIAGDELFLASSNAAMAAPPAATPTMTFVLLPEGGGAAAAGGAPGSAPGRGPAGPDVATTSNLS